MRFDPDTKVQSLSVEGGRPTKTYERFNYRILTLDNPMQPGEKRRLAFKTWVGQKGFKNAGEIQNISANGSFLNNEELAPQLGMDRSRPAAGPRQAPQIRPAARTAPAQAGGRGGHASSTCSARTATG